MTLVTLKEKPLVKGYINKIVCEEGATSLIILYWYLQNISWICCSTYKHLHKLIMMILDDNWVITNIWIKNNNINNKYIYHYTLHTFDASKE